MEQPANKHPTNNKPVTLGEYIRCSREKRNLSAAQLSAELRMHPSYISRLETGALRHPSPEKLHRIAERLDDLNYDDLCALAGYPAPQLPTFLPYLRAKYHMTDDDARRIADYFEQLRQRRGITERHPHEVKMTADGSPRYVAWRDL
jgi:transcriptional regulator with XRE-family HTH domain